MATRAGRYIPTAERWATRHLPLPLIYHRSVLTAINKNRLNFGIDLRG
jgi:hypothetical protein